MITNYKLKEQIMKNNLTENIQYVFENKNLSARDAECGGATNLKEIMEDTTHSIFVGEVQDLIHNDALKPLVYQEGKYV